MHYENEESKKSALLRAYKLLLTAFFFLSRLSEHARESVNVDDFSLKVDLVK